jgi:hypothetical protein
MSFTNNDSLKIKNIHKTLKSEVINSQNILITCRQECLEKGYDLKQLEFMETTIKTFIPILQYLEKEKNTIDFNNETNKIDPYKQRY